MVIKQSKVFETIEGIQKVIKTIERIESCRRKCLNLQSSEYSITDKINKWSMTTFDYY